MENFDDKQALEQAKELQRYEGKVVALVNDKVVASGESVEEVAKKAEEAGYKRYTFFLVPSGKVRFAL
jgi:orotate phosphoribosyltransferase